MQHYILYAGNNQLIGLFQSGNIFEAQKFVDEKILPVRMKFGLENNQRFALKDGWKQAEPNTCVRDVIVVTGKFVPIQIVKFQIRSFPFLLNSVYDKAKS